MKTKTYVLSYLEDLSKTFFNFLSTGLPIDLTAQVHSKMQRYGRTPSGIKMKLAAPAGCVFISRTRRSHRP